MNVRRLDRLRVIREILRLTDAGIALASTHFVAKPERRVVRNGGSRYPFSGPTLGVGIRQRGKTPQAYAAGGSCVGAHMNLLFSRSTTGGPSVAVASDHPLSSVKQYKR